MQTPSRNRKRGLILIPIFGAVFWVTALIASSLPGMLVLGVNVHGIGTASYAGDPGVSLAPLSQQIINDASRDTGGSTVVATATPQPTTSPSGRVDATPVGPASTPAATPSPSSSVSGSALPLPLPSATPLPSLLPSPTPTPTPSVSKASITGQVIDEVTHLAIAAATVGISGGPSTLTDVNGNFGFSVNPGTYTLTASATGYTSASQTVTVNGGQSVGVTFKLVSLTATGGIKGNVTNSVTSAAVVGATLALSNGLTAVTDLNGNFSFPVVLYGTYTLTASAVGYVTQSQSVTVKPGHATTLNYALVP